MKTEEAANKTVRQNYQIAQWNEYIQCEFYPNTLWYSNEIGINLIANENGADDKRQRNYEPKDTHSHRERQIVRKRVI